MFFHFRYAMAGWAFRWLVDAAQDQCVVLQGISGSGKSHSISVLLHCLCGTNNNNNLLNQRLLNANVILNCKLGVTMNYIILSHNIMLLFLF
jgi:myosin heavy subunit